MLLSSSLPLGLLYFRHWHTDDSEIGVVVAKAVFERRADGSLKTIKPAPDLIMGDVFAGDVAVSPLLTEQEIAPAKPATDLTLHAVAHAPGGRPAEEWEVAVSIPDKLHYACRVRGPCLWTKGLKGWVLNPPAAVSEVPLSYALAYGGMAQGGGKTDQPACHEANPAGIGYATQDSLTGNESFAAPQIGTIADFARRSPLEVQSVAGFGPIAKAWLPRRAHAGTFDDEWQAKRHPRMPLDYDLRFWNAAPHHLQIAPCLVGDETIHLDGLARGGERVSLHLPGVRLMLAATGPGVSKAHTMKLDTVQIDMRDPAPENHRVTVLWRALVTGPERFDAATVDSARLGETA